MLSSSTQNKQKNETNKRIATGFVLLLSLSPTESPLHLSLSLIFLFTEILWYNLLFSEMALQIPRLTFPGVRRASVLALLAFTPTSSLCPPTPPAPDNSPHFLQLPASTSPTNLPVMFLPTNFSLFLNIHGTPNRPSAQHPPRHRNRTIAVPCRAGRKEGQASRTCLIPPPFLTHTRRLLTAKTLTTWITEP